MDSFAIAVKAFIVQDGKALLLRRRSNDDHKPNEWDIPGGRLQPGEDPLIGIQREAKEEAGLDITVKLPVHVQHFTRDDGQVITMIIFLCSITNTDITLSEEHQEYLWKNIEEQNEFPLWLYPVLKNIAQYRLI